MIFLLCLIKSSFGFDPVLTSFDDPRLSWHNGVPDYTIQADGITIIPRAGLDYWSKTFYDPLLVKNDAQTLLTTVEVETEVTLETTFTLAPRAQFDQAGIMILVDSDTWVKAGIEYTDGSPRLSCVVTNDGFSDWSTQVWDDWDQLANTTSIRIRVTKLLPGKTQGPALVFEASRLSLPEKWIQVRIASLRSGDLPWRMGIFSMSPIEAANSFVRFHNIRLGPKRELVHGSNAGLPKEEL